MKSSAVFEEKGRTLELEMSALKRECSECEQKLNSMKKVQKENSSLTIQVSRCVFASVWVCRERRVESYLYFGCVGGVERVYTPHIM